jgi:hypothetical protein
VPEISESVRDRIREDTLDEVIALLEKDKKLRPAVRRYVCAVITLELKRKHE